MSRVNNELLISNCLNARRVPLPAQASSLNIALIRFCFVFNVSYCEAANERRTILMYASKLFRHHDLGCHVPPFLCLFSHYLEKIWVYLRPPPSLFHLGVNV